MDHAVFDFLGADMHAAARAKQDVAAWHATLARLFTDRMTNGMPLPAGETRARAVERQTRNAEVSLLAALSAATAAAPAGLPRVKLPESSLGATLHRLLEPVTGLSVARRSLNALDLRGANLRGAHIRGAYLRRADLSKANLTDADLRGVDFSDVNLTGAVGE